MGGLARQRLHGDLGTPEGRHLGGVRSLVTHARRKTAFKRRLTIRLPRHSELLAEFFGAMMGDGHVDVYQAVLTTNSETDMQHARHIKSLAQTLFGIKARLVMRSPVKACVVVMSSVALCEYLHSQGLPKGSKVHLGIKIPAWIAQDRRYARACGRGLFDTDGSVYLDTHVIKGRLYSHIGVVFTSRTPSLLTFFNTVLVDAGLHPTQTSRYAVFLRRAKEVERYFELFGTSNPKHRTRYERFKRTIRRGVRVVE